MTKQNPMTELINTSIAKYFYRNQSEACRLIGMEPRLFRFRKNNPSTFRGGEIMRMAIVFHWTDKEIAKAVRGIAA